MTLYRAQSTLGDKKLEHRSRRQCEASPAPAPTTGQPRGLRGFLGLHSARQDHIPVFCLGDQPPASTPLPLRSVPAHLNPDTSGPR